MSGKQRAWLALASAIVLAGTCGFFLWHNRPALAQAKAKPTDSPAATVHKTTEEEMGRVVLSEASEKHLGVRTAPVERKSVRQQRTYGGEVTVPVGRTVLVAAPLSGTLQTPEGGVPIAGS